MGRKSFTQITCIQVTREGQGALLAPAAYQLYFKVINMPKWDILGRPDLGLQHILELVAKMKGNVVSLC